MPHTPQSRKLHRQLLRAARSQMGVTPRGRSRLRVRSRSLSAGAMPLYASEQPWLTGGARGDRCRKGASRTKCPRTPTGQFKKVRSRKSASRKHPRAKSHIKKERSRKNASRGNIDARLDAQELRAAEKRTRAKSHIKKERSRKNASRGNIDARLDAALPRAKSHRKDYVISVGDTRLIVDHVQFTPQTLYKIFRDDHVTKFANKFAFINADFLQGRRKIVFKGYEEIPPNMRHIQWHNVKCKEISDYIKVSPCEIGTSKKIFYKAAESLKDYIERLDPTYFFRNRGDWRLSRADHMTLFDTVLKFFAGSDFINHNMDVGFLHFKGP